MRWVHILALAAAGSIAAQPCLAAGFAGQGSGLAGGGVVRARMGAFAGASVALPFGSVRAERPRARLQLGPSYGLYDARSGGMVGSVRAPGLELGLTRRGAAAWSLAGQSAPELQRRMGFKGSTGYIVVGGLVVGVLLLAALASASPKPGPRPGDF